MKPTTITFKKCALTALATFMISACGSSGGITNHADKTQPSQPQAAQPQAPQAPQASQPQSPQAPQAAQPQAPQSPQASQPQAQLPQAAQPQAPQSPQASQPQMPQSPQAAQPQAPQPPQALQPQAPQAPQVVQPQTPQPPQAVQPQTPQPPQAAQPQTPQSPQVAQPQTPQPPQVVQPQTPQPPQAVQPQTPQAPQAAQPQAPQPPQASQPQAPQAPQASQPQAPQAPQVVQPLPAQPAPSQPQPQSPATPPNQPETGSALVYSPFKSQYGIRKLTDYNTGMITVDGVGIIISLPHYKANDWLKQGLTVDGDNRKLKVCCGKYSDIRFGVNTSLDVDDEYLFYNGNPTANMPTSGTATYTGEAVMAASNVGPFGQEPYPLGRSHFDVDFGNKTLAGYLSIPAIIPNTPNVEVGINAQISGNGFSGTTTSAIVPNGRVEGKFYGDDASEMAGLAEGKGGAWGAAFGAAKQ